jgi:uncharacterized protein
VFALRVQSMPTQIFLGFSPQLQFHNQRKQLQ